MNFDIPKRIHQIWIGPDKPPAAWLNSWERFHPLWRYKLWQESDFPEIRNRAQYEACPTRSGQADILRCEILAEHGGIYLDADLEARRPLDTLFGSTLARAGFVTVYANERATPGRLANGIMAAVPGHPILARLIEEIGRLDPEYVAATPAHVATGPRLLTRVVREAADASVKILPSHTFLPWHHTGLLCTPDEWAQAYAVHYWQPTYHPARNARK